MERSERWKTLLCFALFGVVVLALFVRLVYLQGGRATPNRVSVSTARNLYDKVPAPRGAIVDRLGRMLAYDRPVVTVRAEFHARVAKGVDRIPAAHVELLVTRLASHLTVGADGARARAGLRRKLTTRIRARKPRLLPTKSKKFDYLRAEFLVARDLDAHAVIRRLRGESDLWRRRREMPGLLHLGFLKSYRRTYPDREFTRGPVGTHYIAKPSEVRIDGRVHLVPREGYTGLESCRGLWPTARPESEGGNGSYYTLDFRDSRRRRFWTGIGEEPAPAARLRTTLDLDLQKLAHAELRAAATAVEAHYKSTYEWGAMVLVEIATGDVLALASHYPGRRGATPFAPIENVFEPGSVVKPLLIALALERGKVDWQRQFDCTPTGANNSRPVAGYPTRIIRDDHRSEKLYPEQIIAHSSNIGAVMIGTSLGREGLAEYLEVYGFGRRTDLGIPAEARGGRPRGSKPLATMRAIYFGRDTAPSLSFGYELNVTAVQLARAYVTLLSGRPSELRLVAGAHTGERELSVPAVRPAARFLSVATVARITAAMGQVVSADPRATGRHLHKMLKDLGHEQPLIAGKTGTTDSRIAGVRKKTATFIGVAPVCAPRFLVVCVLRKDRATGFYGGSYAAFPAGRLLLGALALSQQDRQPQEERVSAWTGARGEASNKK